MKLQIASDQHDSISLWINSVVFKLAVIIDGQETASTYAYGISSMNIALPAIDTTMRVVAKAPNGKVKAACDLVYQGSYTFIARNTRNFDIMVSGFTISNNATRSTETISNNATRSTETISSMAIVHTLYDDLQRETIETDRLSRCENTHDFIECVSSIITDLRSMASKYETMLAAYQQQPTILTSWLNALPDDTFLCTFCQDKGCIRCKTDTWLRLELM